MGGKPMNGPVRNTVRTCLASQVSVQRPRIRWEPTWLLPSCEPQCLSFATHSHHVSPEIGCCVAGEAFEYVMLIPAWVPGASHPNRMDFVPILFDIDMKKAPGRSMACSKIVPLRSTGQGIVARQNFKLLKTTKQP